MIKNINILWRLLKLFRPYWAWMLVGIGLSLITILANVSLLALAGWFITMMAVAGAAAITEVNYFTPAAAVRGFAIARTASRYGERVISHEATFRLTAALRVWFYQHLEPLAPAVLQKYHSADLLSRIKADIDHLENFYIRIFSPIIVALISTACFIFFLQRYDQRLAIIEIVFLLFAGLLFPLFVNHRTKTSGERIITNKTALRMTSTDNIQGMGDLLIYGATQEQTKKLSQLTEALLQDQKQQASLNGFSQAALSLCANLTMWLFLLLAIPLYQTGHITAEHIPMLALFALASFEAIAPLPLALQLLPETLKSASRIFEIVDSKPIVPEPETASPQPTNFDISFNKVCFQYPESENKVLNDLSFELLQGKNLAIIGPSGNGKTSIVNLILKFWPINNGTITLGGHNLNDYHGEDCRQYISAVSQQTILFNSTIKRNLLLAKQDASDEQIEHACRTAQINDFINSQPDGYDTWIGEAGLKLSGGQARRLAVARALLKDTPILLLDEPGESLDNQTERQMLDAIFEDCKDKSILLITHKMVSERWVDEVVCL